jgi:DMSO reductase family type II enzyme heme b subunit
MKVHYVGDTTIESLLDPESKAWQRQAAERVGLMGTPVGLQPTAAIRVAWMNKPIGVVGEVAVRAVHDGEVLAIHLEWEDATESLGGGDNDSFPDAAAVAFPAVADAPLVTMGAPGKPVNAWYWRADEEGRARQVAAEGLGTSRTLDRQTVRSGARWKEGRWRVVLVRPLKAAGPGSALLEPGVETGFGVAIWEGSNAERAGLKAFSGDWLPIVLEPLPTGGQS